MVNITPEPKLEKIQEQKEEEGNSLLSSKILGTLLAKARRNRERALYATLGAVSRSWVEGFNFYIAFDSPSYYDEANKDSNKKNLEQYINDEYPRFNLNIKLIEKENIKIDYLSILKKEFRIQLIIKNKKGARRNV